MLLLFKAEYVDAKRETIITHSHFCGLPTVTRTGWIEQAAAAHPLLRDILVCYENRFYAETTFNPPAFHGILVSDRVRS